jgi:hypothetical protein
MFEKSFFLKLHLSAPVIEFQWKWLFTKMEIYPELHFKF